jgi:hypothetical protein
MALIQINAKVFCLMALLMISTSFLTSQALGRNIGIFPSTAAYQLQKNLNHTFYLNKDVFIGCS